MRSISAPRPSDLLNVTGTIDLANARLTGSLVGTFNAAGVYTVIHTTAGVSGTFDGVSEGSAVNIGGHAYQVHYGSDDVVLTAVANGAPGLTGCGPTVTINASGPSATPQILDNNVSFNDVEGNFNGGFATLTLTGLLPEDTVSILQIGFDPGQFIIDTGRVLFEGNDIGGISGGTGNNLTVTFNGAATSRAVDALIENLTYVDNSSTPTTSRTLTLTVTDDLNASTGPKNILVTFDQAPVAQNGSASGNEDTAISSAVAATDPNGDTLTYSLSGTNGGAVHGTVALNSNGTFTYTPAADFNGSDSFSFIANDGVLDSNTATESVTVNAVNDPPVFAHFGATHTSATEQTFVRLNSAATVSDVELDAANGGAGNYAGASLIIGRGGSPVSNPDDTFSFSSTGATFTVDTVNHVLRAGGLQFATYSIPSSGSLNGTISVNFNSLNTPATTALVNDVLQHISYKNLSDTPPASVTMHYTFNDGNAGPQGSGGVGTDTANRIVDITPVNDAPVAHDGSASGAATITGTLSATDVDSASLTYAAVAQTAHGSVTVNADGTFTYTANSGYSGADSFTFKANDGSLDSNVATENLTVIAGAVPMGRLTGSGLAWPGLAGRRRRRLQSRWHQRCALAQHHDGPGRRVAAHERPMGAVAGSGYPYVR